VKARAIVNPLAAGGSLRKHWPRIEAVLREETLAFETCFTRGRGHATELARNAVSEGCSLVIAVGGDGTLHDVVNGMVSDGGSLKSDATLGIIPCGTGADFVRTVGVPSDLVPAARHVARTVSSRLIDIGEVSYQAGGKRMRRYFINVAGLGLDAEVAARAGRGGKPVGGPLPYFAALLSTLVRHRCKPLTVRIDSAQVQGNMNAVIIGNGRYFGGGMFVAPHALLDDGLLEVIVVGDYSPLALLWHSPKVYRGAHLRLRKVHAFRGQVVSVESEQRILLQADGEVIGEGPATFRVLPAALRIRV
jgi:diacylglycerol kinase (ATP)